MSAYLESNGLMVPRSLNGHGLRESRLEYALAVELLESRIIELEARLQEQGWTRLGDEAGREFSRDRLGDLIDIARMHYLRNPIIKRGVDVGALYVWGQDLNVSAADPNVKQVTDRFWRENRATLTGQQASRLLQVEIEVAGNVFLALFPDTTSGSVAVRTVPVEEIREIVSNPEDRYEPWFYLRKWRQRRADGSGDDEQRALYPDWRHTPTNKPAAVQAKDGEIPIRWETPLLHVKAGAFPHWRWGVPTVYAALDWAKAYKELLEDDATRSRALARFAWRITTDGGRAAVQAAKTRLGSTLGANGGTGSETNPPPVAGSAFIGDKSVGLDPIRIAGATLNPDHSRPARLMAASALGLPDTFFGDVDQGTLATAKTLDRPTELKYAEWRQMWKDVFVELIQFVINADLNATGGILRATPSDEARAVVVSWPDILEKSITERVDAVVKAATLGSQSPAGTIATETLSRMLLVALGAEDVDGEVEKATEERAEREEKAAQIAQQQTPPEQDEEREAFVEALRGVRQLLATAGER